MSAKIYTHAQKTDQTVTTITRASCILHMRTYFSTSQANEPTYRKITQLTNNTLKSPTHEAITERKQLTTAWRKFYTVSPKTSALYSFNNSVKLQPILIIFGTRNSEVI